MIAGLFSSRPWRSVSEPGADVTRQQRVCVGKSPAITDEGLITQNDAFFLLRITCNRVTSTRAVTTVNVKSYFRLRFRQN